MACCDDAQRIRGEIDILSFLLPEPNRVLARPNSRLVLTMSVRRLGNAAKNPSQNGFLDCLLFYFECSNHLHCSKFLVLGCRKFQGAGKRDSISRAVRP